MAQERKFGTTWSCVKCGEDKPPMEHADFIKHLEEVHQIKDTQGNKKGLAFMDGSGYAIQVYEWEIGGLKFIQTTTCKR